MSKLVLKESKLREIIKESVRSILNEAMTQGFSFQKLEELTDPKDKINYCTDYLGDIIGKGSSRVVFEIDDAQVLKLAYGSMYEAGISQNMYRPFEINAEEKYNKKNPDLLGYEDYRIKKQNTPQGHTISFGAIITTMKHLIEGTDIEYVKNSYPYECEVINNHPWFKELFNLCKNHQLMIGDVAVQNMGITLRNGKPAVVILDSGLTEEILNKHYKYF